MMATLFPLKSNLIKELPFIGSKVTPTNLKDTFLIEHSQSCADLLDLPENYWQLPEFTSVLSGESLAADVECVAQVYAGHQFGQYVPQLGDGRALSLGEITNNSGHTYDIQLKGAGLTPYSRMGDGRAVLRSSIREFLASEAMAALGIPTTRALSLVGSDEDVYREHVEKGAIVARVAQSHIRFGHFEYWYHQGKMDELTQLANYCIDKFYPVARQQENPYLTMFEHIIARTAKLIAKWQAHGFAHGVMNTDNMSIIGLTIDYGPFGFLDDYNPGFICNHSDHSGRYAFDQQPSIGLWNLNALAVTFSSWLSAEEITTALQSYEPILVEHYLSIMQHKLGLSDWLEKDQALLGRLLAIMAAQKADYSLSFRHLNSIKLSDMNNQECSQFLSLFNQPEVIKEWLVAYRQRLATNGYSAAERIDVQNNHNALYILRNYLAQAAIQQAELHSYDMLHRLKHVLSTPFTEQENTDMFAQSAPQWGKELSISCSS